jgi:hypothetical protein
VTTTTNARDYNIVVAKSPEALVLAVKTSMEMGGWQPQGGPIFVNTTQGAVLMQALVIPDEQKVIPSVALPS